MIGIHSNSVLEIPVPVKKDQANNTPRAAKPLDTVVEFQRRRKLATKRGGPFLASTVLCVIGMVVLYNVDVFSPERRATLYLFLGAGFVISWMLHLYFETKHARCPNCESLPVDERGSLNFDPEHCPKCGARLRAYSSLF